VEEMALAARLKASPETNLPVARNGVYRPAELSPISRSTRRCAAVILERGFDSDEGSFLGQAEASSIVRIVDNQM